jgi:integrase
MSPSIERKAANKAYPKYWRLRRRHNKFIVSFRVPTSIRHLWENKAEVTLGLGDTQAEAERQAFYTWAKKIHADTTPMSMADLFDKYSAEVIPEKSPKTQSSNRDSIKRLRAVCGEIPVLAYKTHMAYQYRDAVAKTKSEKIANLDLQVLSHCFTKAFEWGVDLVEHPIKGKVTKFTLQARDRYVTDEELEWFLSVANPFLNAYIPLKIATGKDQSMILAIKLTDIKEDSLFFPKRFKTEGKSKNVKASSMPFMHNGQSTGLKEILDGILLWRKSVKKAWNSEYLFVARTGLPYFDGKNNSAFKSIWQRAMTKALKDTALTEKFTEHDLCSKTASDVETVEEAARLRGHTNLRTTTQNYRVKPETVIPHKKKDQ